MNSWLLLLAIAKLFERRKNKFTKWCPQTELNRHLIFRKDPFYPFEL
jgi:hypothetical protein